MKILRRLVPLVLLVPGLTLAQGAESPLFTETSYLLRTLKPAPLDDLMAECAFAQSDFAGADISGGNRRGLFTMEIDPDTGKIQNNKNIRVGELLTCLGPAESESELPGYPTVDTATVFSFTLNGRDYVASGTSRLRTPPGFLEGSSEGVQGMHLTGTDATVWLMVEGQRAIMVGTMTLNQLNNPTSVPGYDEGAVISLRLFSGFDVEDNEALVAALKRAGILN